MEEVPDMDDLLDEMESDLIRKSRSSHPPAPLPPTTIGMQPQAIPIKPASQKYVVVPPFNSGEDMNNHMEGHININTSQLPNTFHLKTSVSPSEEFSTGEEHTQSERNHSEQPNGSCQPQLNGCKAQSVDESNDRNTPVEPEPEPEDVSEVEEETLVPETQVISNANVTIRDLQDESVRPAASSKEAAALDTEMESMLEYLNGFEEPSAVHPVEDVQERRDGGRDSVSESIDNSIVSQYAEQLSEELISSALMQPRKLHYDPAVQEFYETNDSTQEIFAMSLNETQSTVDSDHHLENENYLPEPDIGLKKTRMASVEEENESAVQLESSNEPLPEDETEETAAEVRETTEIADTESINQAVGENICNEAEEDAQATTDFSSTEATPTSSLETVSDADESSESTVITVIENVLPVAELCVPQIENGFDQNFEQEVVSDTPVFDEGAAIEAVRQEDVHSTVVVNASDNEDSSLDTVDEETESRPRFDSSIATVHVLHESDSDESGTVRRERRLTESELQLGKTSPYWIPDSECPNCMLCNSKIITRRHHCRACGRVLCGSCCNDKAVLEYLQEAGKKAQAVRVCKPCASMLARIEVHEQEERNRRESISSDVEVNPDDVPVSSVPRGVLKTRASTHVNEEEGASTSSNGTTSVGGLSADSSRRSVMFRDGIRPGAPADEENPEEERSTALKPKKKSRKRTSVVRRIAELRMEDELACALPKEGITKLLIIKPESDQPKFEDASTVLETLCNFSVVTIVLKKNLNCTIQIFNNPNFGLIWAVSSQGFAQIGLDELLFAWTLSDREKQKMEAEEPELDETVALSYIPLSVLQRISNIYTHSTEYEFAGVRRAESRLGRVHSVMNPTYPLTKHVMLFRPTVQAGLENLRIPVNPFLVACFLHDDELNWATALPNRLLYKLGEKYNVYPTPFVNDVGRPSLYSTDVSGTVLKMFTDFRSWSYRMRHIPGCTVSLTNEKTIIRIPKSTISDLKDILNVSRSMVAWSCDLHHDDDSLLICEESEPGIYSTQVFAKYIGQRESTSVSFVILGGGSKVNSLQVNVVEDGVTIRVQSDRLETILNAMNEGHDVVETSQNMELRVEFIEDGDWISDDNNYYPKSQIDDLYLMNKFQYGLSLERALTQVLQVQNISDYGVRMSHVYNLGEGRLQPEEEPKIYGMVEIAAKECVAMLEPHMQFLIRAGIGSFSIRLFVSRYEFEYEVSGWLGLEDENRKYKQSLDQLIPMLYNMIEYVPNGFEVEFVLSIVSTKALPI